MKTYRTHLLNCAMALSLTIGIGAVAQAQETETDENARRLSTVTVTATKQEESLQDVPLSIEAVTGDTLTAFAVDDLTDLSALVPNFTVGEGITTTAITMRGLGSGQERSFEQAVGMFIDGQYMPRSRQYRSPFFDIDRVEVVKGPQAVYFGLNSTAGAVSIISKQHQPGDATNGFVAADYDLDYGGPSLEGAVGFGGDKIGVRLAGKFTDKDGYFRNSLSDMDENGQEDTLLRASVIIEPAENFTITGKAEFSDYSTDGHIGEIYGLASTAIEVDAALGQNDGVLNWVRSSNGSSLGAAGFLPSSPGTDGDSQYYQIGAEYALANGGTISGKLGHSQFEYQLVTDLDTTYLGILDAGIQEDYDQTSVDLRYASDADKPFGFMVGGYYHTTELTNAQPNVYGLQAGLAGFIGADTVLLSEGQFGLESDLMSVFGLLRFDLNDQWSGTVGARYSDETKDVTRDSRCLTGNVLTNAVAPGPGFLAGAGLCPDPALNGFSDSRSSDNLMPEATLNYKPNDDVMFYVNIGNSAKSGGFASATNARAQTLEYDDESVIGGEIGVKTSFWDGRGELNAAVFRSEFSDLQVNSFLINPGPPQTTEPVIANAADAVSQGIEIDGRILATDWLTLGGSIAFLDAEFEKFPAAPCNRQTTPGPLGFCDLSGKSLPFAAENSGNLFAEIDLPLANGWDLDGGVLLSFSGEYFTDGTLDETAVQDSWSRVGAHIGITYQDMYKLELIGSNLTDEKVLGSTQPFGGSYNLGYLDPPKMVKVRLSAKFGQ